MKKDNDGPEAGYIEPIGDRKKPAMKMVKRKYKRIRSNEASVSKPMHKTSGGRTQMVGGGSGYGLKKKKSTYLTKEGIKKAREIGKQAYEKGKAEYEAKPKLIKKNR